MVGDKRAGKGALLIALLAAGGGAAYWLDLLGLQNEAPSSRLVVEPKSGEAPLKVTAEAGDSSDPENDQLSFRWFINEDEQPEDGVSLVRDFDQPGTRFSGRGGRHDHSLDQVQVGTLRDDEATTGGRLGEFCGAILLAGAVESGHLE